MANKLTIKTFNIANARGDEMSTEWRFGKRLQYVIDEINKSHSDVVAIQEIRACQNFDGTKILSPSDIMCLLVMGTGLACASFERVGVRRVLIELFTFFIY